MNTVNFKVETLSTALETFSKAWKTGKASQPTISFESWELMHRTLAPKRLEILKAMCGQGALSIRQIARKVERDFKGVHTDVTSLLEAGIIERADRGVIFAYDRIHVEFDIDAAA